MLTAAAFCLADLVLDFSSRLWSARSSADRRIAGGGSSHLKALDPPQPRRAKHTTEGKAHHEGHGTPQRARHTTKGTAHHGERLNTRRDPLRAWNLPLPSVRNTTRAMHTTEGKTDISSHASAVLLCWTCAVIPRAVWEFTLQGTRPTTARMGKTKHTQGPQRVLAPSARRLCLILLLKTKQQTCKL